jgi:heme/copper-type cytochrome/quinol oxidase subunit 3
MTTRPVIDVSQLPTYTFGHRSPVWWGAVGFMLIEGIAFVMAIAIYLYLLQANRQWPIGVGPPPLLWGTLNTAVLLASAIPNQWTLRAARREDLRRTRIGMIICLAFAVVYLVLRAFEFRNLNCSWDTNAYGSIVWFIMGLHTTHLVTDAGDTVVLLALLFRQPVKGKSYSDVNDNSVYWYFVVAAWLPLYFVVYWVPRLT